MFTNVCNPLTAVYSAGVLYTLNTVHNTSCKSDSKHQDSLEKTFRYTSAYLFTTIIHTILKSVWKKLSTKNRHFLFQIPPHSRLPH